jgi:deoxyribonuclease V
LDTTQARELQKVLAAGVDATRSLPSLNTVAAADVSYDLRGKWLFAAVVVTRQGTEEIVEKASAVTPVRFPYVPGLLSFREAPPVVQAYEQLREHPDVLLIDGQGIAHPRRFGLASHLGLWLGIPTIGCAKSWLIGEFNVPGPERGEWSPLVDQEVTVGAVLRTRSKVKPLFVSTGHLCDLPSAIRVVLDCCPRYRLPTPARLAHHFVNELRRVHGAGLGG